MSVMRSIQTHGDMSLVLLQAMNQAGLARMCRMLAVLQPFLAGLGATMSLFRPEAARHLEKARAYYAHLTYAPQALIAAALSKPTRFTVKEYLALLEVSFVQSYQSPVFALTTGTI